MSHFAKREPTKEKQGHLAPAHTLMHMQGHPCSPALGGSWGILNQFGYFFSELLFFYCGKIYITSLVPVAHASNPSYSGSRDQKHHGSKPPGLMVCETLTQKYPTQNRASRVARVVEHLPAKCETLSSNPSASKKKKKEYM
jgi:hypothetical protein